MNGALQPVHPPFMDPRACWACMATSPQPLAAPGVGVRRRAAVGLLWALCGSLGLAWPAAHAGRDDGQRARAAREQGRIVPLEDLIAQVTEVVPGRLLEAELDDDDGLLIYELRWQLADGRRLEIELDARDGRWLKLKGPRLETVFKPAPGTAVPGARGQGAVR
jgi:hypothetical protein